MSDIWLSELWRVLVLALVALGVGFAVGYPAVALLIIALGYLAWHLYHIERLYSWVAGKRRFNSLESYGVWDEIYHALTRLQQRYTQRKRRMQRLLHRFQETASAMPDAAVVLRERGEIEWWNDAAGQYLGLRHPTDVGQRIANLVRHPQFSDFMQAADFSAAIEFPAPHNPNLMLEIRIVPYGRQHQLMLARDTTRLHKLEQVRRDFVANVSHELRTPLTVMQGYLETLRDADDPALQKWSPALDSMMQQATRMSHMVEDLLLLSRLEMEHIVPRTEEVAVADLLANIVAEARVLSGTQQHMISLVADEALRITGAPHELRGACANLIFNAVRYTPAGGRIDIAWQRDGAHAVLTVADNGIGIAPQHISRLTERFYRVDPDRSRASGGTGLGLAIVKHVLQRHDAILQITSEVDKGSIFVCRFPVRPELA